MDKAGPLTTQIAASIEDVKALLDDNRSLSVAYLSRRQTDFEEQVRKRLAAVEESVTRLSKRVDQAGTKYKELREDVDEKLGSK